MFRHLAVKINNILHYIPLSTLDAEGLISFIKYSILLLHMTHALTLTFGYGMLTVHTTGYCTVHKLYDSNCMELRLAYTV